MPDPNPDVHVEETAEDLLLQAVQVIAEGMASESALVLRGKTLIAQSFIAEALNKMLTFPAIQREAGPVKGVRR